MKFHEPEMPARAMRRGNPRRWFSPLQRPLIGLASMTAVAAGLWSVQPTARAASPDGADLVGKTLWFAPHRGCLGRVVGGRNPDGSLQRFQPEQAESFQVLGLRNGPGKSGIAGNGSAEHGPKADSRHRLLELRAASGFVGRTELSRVIEDLRFDPQPATFHQICFFLEPPGNVAGYLRATYPLAFQRYSGYTPAERAAVIESLRAEDRRAAAKRSKQPPSAR